MLSSSVWSCPDAKSFSFAKELMNLFSGEGMGDEDVEDI